MHTVFRGRAIRAADMVRKPVARQRNELAAQTLPDVFTYLVCNSGACRNWLSAQGLHTVFALVVSYAAVGDLGTGLAAKPRLNPLHQLQDDAVRVGDLEVAFAPGFGFDRGDDRDACAVEAVVFGIDVVYDEGDQ